MSKTAGLCALALIFFVSSVADLNAEQDPATVSDHAFLELRSQLLAHPEGPQSRRILFALGEYFFQQNLPEMAAGYFARLNPEPSRGPQDLLAAVYLARAARQTHNESSAAHLEDVLKQTLASKSFFTSSSEARTQQWRSALGSRYELRESVDTWEIFLNGRPFYTIRLA